MGGFEVPGKKWSIEGRYIEFCSCDHGCPCDGMAEPTYGDCTGLVAFKIDKGACENVPLDDLAVVGTFYFPRALHHGDGVFQPIIDDGQLRRSVSDVPRPFGHSEIKVAVG
jgi:hypothetical protein